jgi:predicted HTH transcriptional regulator
MLDWGFTKSVNTMNIEYLNGLVSELLVYAKETEWIEFKHNINEPDMIGEYISALSNSSALHGKLKAYILWGIDDVSHEIIGTSFNPFFQKIGNEELENWLLKLLNPKINFKFYEIKIDDKPVVMLEISSASGIPVQFRHIEYIRVGSYKKKLKDFPEKERELWRIFDKIPFESQIALENINADRILNLLDYPQYFKSLNLPLPDNKKGILHYLEADGLINKNETNNFNITFLGAILFARDFKDFQNISRKAARLIIYKGINRIETIREQQETKGYVCGFEDLINYIISILPSNEIISGALRKTLPMFPILAVRELIANALIHQDFSVTGTSPMIEIFDNRIEITNPGLPLVKTDRFLDSPPKSRNETLASFMRRVGICEERGSGFDKVVFQTEYYQLPAPLIETTDEHTRVVLFAHREFKDMDKENRIRACYLHSCLKYVQREYMTNTSLRERFGIDEKNSAQVSRIIKDSIDDGKIKCYDESVGSKARRYLPCWA